MKKHGWAAIAVAGLSLSGCAVPANSGLGMLGQAMGIGPTWEGTGAETPIVGVTRITAGEDSALGSYVDFRIQNIGTADSVQVSADVTALKEGVVVSRNGAIRYDQLLRPGNSVDLRAGLGAAHSLADWDCIEYRIYASQSASGATRTEHVSDWIRRCK